MSYEESFSILRLHTIGLYYNGGLQVISSTENMIILRSLFGGYCLTPDSVQINDKLLDIESGKCIFDDILRTSSIIMRDLLKNPAYREFYGGVAYSYYYFEKQRRIFRYIKDRPEVQSVPIPEVRYSTSRIDFNFSIEQQKATIHTLEEFIDIISNNKMKSARFFE
jgi:hypothetical protein